MIKSAAKIISHESDLHRHFKIDYDSEYSKLIKLVLSPKYGGEFGAYRFYLRHITKRLKGSLGRNSKNPLANNFKKCLVYP